MTREAFRVASAIPGRVRVQWLGPGRRNGALRNLSARLSELPGVECAEAVRDAGCVVVRFSPRRSLDQTLAAIAEAAATVANHYAPPPSVPPVEAAAPSPASVEIAHALPGRVRLRIPYLSRRPRLARALRAELASAEGIHRVETPREHDSLIVHYDERRHGPRRILRWLEQLLARPLVEIGADGRIARAADIAKHPPLRVTSLAVPTIAVALAASASIPFVLSGALVALAALPIAARAARGARNRRFNVDQLDLAALVVMAAQGHLLAGGIMTWFVGLGDYIRARTMRKSEHAIAELMSPRGKQAWLRRGDTVVSVELEHLAPGDTVVVYPGDQIPVDGVVTDGRGLVEQKLLTGEPNAVTKEAGDRVYALTVVADGQLDIRVEQIGSATRAGRVVQMIENAPLSDTRVQDYASALGDRLVAPIFGLAGAVYLVTRDPLRAAAVLIMDFVTGIRVSAPTTILSAMARGAREGLFIKGGKAIEKLAQVDAIVFDKTGTLTRGAPVLTTAHSFLPGVTGDEVLFAAACAEANMKHPAARAIVDAAASRGMCLMAPAAIEYVLGQGVQASIGAYTLHVGSLRFFEARGIAVEAARLVVRQRHDAGDSLVFVALDGRLAGLLAYSDPPRSESALVVEALRRRGVKRIVMLTGDNRRAAMNVGREIGITDIVADAFPEQKADVVERLRDEGYTVGVIGDGINDSPAFTRADVGISLEHGADAAKETADVVLLEGDLRALPRAIDLAREAMGVLRQNVNLVVGPTAVGMGAAVAGLATPLVCTLLNNGTSVVAGLNALRPLYSKPRGARPNAA